MDISSDTYVSIEFICKRLSISRSTLDRYRKNDQLGFPKPKFFIGKHPRFSASEVNLWLNSLPRTDPTK